MSGYLVPDTDRHDRASTLSCLGTVAQERFADARVAGEGEPVLLEHLNAALRSYQQSLELTPADDHQARGAREHQLGIVYSRAGDTSQALRHYQRSGRWPREPGQKMTGYPGRGPEPRMDLLCQQPARPGKAPSAHTCRCGRERGITVAAPGM